MFYHFSFVKNVTKLKCNSLVSKSLNGFFYRTLTLSRYGFQQKKMVYPDCLNDPPRIKTIKVYRYDPEDLNSKPYLQKFEVDLNKCGLMVIDALHYIKANFDQTVSFRRSCGEGLCGACSMNINGVNTLACITKIPPYLSDELIIYPLPHMYVIRDLIGDMTHFLNQYKAIEPHCKRPGEEEFVGSRSLLQSQKDRKKIDGTFECILCACCTYSCPPYYSTGDKYLGPAVLLHAYRWVVDSRDLVNTERLDKVRDYFSMFRCKGVYNCTKTCPKGLNPAKAIAELKRLTAGLVTKDAPEIVSPPPKACPS